METQRTRLSTDPDTENSQDDSLSGGTERPVCLGPANKERTLSGVSEVNSTWIIQDPIGRVKNLYVSNYRGCDWTWIAFLIDKPQLLCREGFM